jgi:hypothetical protein
MPRLTITLIAAAFLASTGCYATARESGGPGGQREEARPHEESGHQEKARDQDKNKEDDHGDHAGERDQG